MSENNNEKRGPLAELMDLAEGVTKDQTAGDNYSLAGDRNWKVLETIDDERPGGSGLYGCLIDKGDGTCAIVFRGTVVESGDDALQDVFGADLGLLDTGETYQQAMARIFTSKMYEKYKDRFEEFTFVGHSLGGNLSEHAVITAPPELQAKSRAVSLDGPGFSAEYIAKHAEGIEAMKGKLDRYQWSFVGACLNVLPGERYENLELEGYEGDFIGRQIEKHADYDAIREGRYTPSELKEKDIAILSRSFDALSYVFLPSPTKALTNKILNENIEKLYQEAKRESAEIDEPNAGSSHVSAKGPVHFTVNPQKIGNCVVGLDNTASEIERINDDLIAIRQTLFQYRIISGWNLRMISSSLARQGKKCKIMSAGLKDIAEIYEREEKICVEYAVNA